MNMTWWLMLMGILLFVADYNYCSALECCIGNVTLVVDTESDTNDNTDEHGEPCTNKGNSCKNIGCPSKSECNAKWESNCTDPTDCGSTMTKPVCRLLYFEIAKDARRNEESSSSDLDITLEYYVQRACFENMYDDVKIGCEFYPKISYRGLRERLIYQKECFCDTDQCNINLTTSCILTDPLLKGKKENTCWALSKSSKNGDAMGLSLFTNLIIAAINCMIFRENV